MNVPRVAGDMYRESHLCSEATVHMNSSPKISNKLVVFEPKMVPLGFGIVLGVLDVRNREYWSILLHRKNLDEKYYFIVEKIEF